MEDVPDVFSGLGDSDVKEEYVRVRKLMDTPVTERQEAPVVIVQVLSCSNGIVSLMISVNDD